MSIIRRCAAVTLATGLVVAGAAAPASAANLGQSGLINVGVVLDNVLNDNTVTIQVPVAVALNICDVNVNVIGVIVDTGQVTCDAFAANPPTA